MLHLPSSGPALAIIDSWPDNDPELPNKLTIVLDSFFVRLANTAGFVKHLALREVVHIKVFHINPLHREICTDMALIVP